MNKFILILFAILAVCATTIQASGNCQGFCPQTIPENLSSREDVVINQGSCTGGCGGGKPCKGRTMCIYNPRTGIIQGISSDCGCGSTPTPQVWRAMDIDQA